jgi:hypothetical protein
MQGENSLAVDPTADILAAGISAMGDTNEIDGYQFALIEATGLIAVRRPDGSMRMLPGTKDVTAAVRGFIAKDKATDEDEA